MSCFEFGNIGRMDKTSVSGKRGRRFKSLAVPICRALQQDTVSALLQSIQLSNEHQTGTPS